MKNIFQFTHKVSPEDIDDLNHVNNLKYLEWALKAAGLHWQEMSDAATRKKYVWVVARHEIDYFKPAFEGDEIHIKTWIDEMEKASSIRIIEIYKGNKLIAKVKTTWVLLDAATGRVTRIPAEFDKFIRTD